MFYLSLLLLLILLLPARSYARWKQPVALQPFGEVDNHTLQQVVESLKKNYCKIEVDILPAIPLPRYAYYKPRKRYRARKLLYYLTSYYTAKVKKKYGRIIGITGKDISATKGHYEDWGIFGLAFLNTGPCVVSTFRLKRRAKSREHFMTRLEKVVIHELGHTFGVPHCPSRGCIMEDARGTIKTVDRVSKRFCSKCRSKLFRVLCPSSPAPSKSKPSRSVPNAAAVNP